MSDFKNRITTAQKYETALIEILNQSGFITALNGSEHTCTGFVNKLRQSVDKTSLSIRYQPDGVAHIGKIPRSFYFEVKASKTIEKLAYENYFNLFKNGYIVVLFFAIEESFYWDYIENIEILKINSIRSEIPIIDNWFYPRDLPKEKYNKWKETRKGSGTPYGIVNTSKLKYIDDFKNCIIQKLNDQNLKP